MEKLNIVIITLSIIFVLILGFAIWDICIKDKHNINPQQNTQNQNNNQNTNNPPKETGNKPNTTTLTDLSNFNVNSCVNNTKDNPQCKDCCDCLSGVDSPTRTACRDTCAEHDFNKNSNTITITVPSTLGKEGNYSVCVAKGSAECKTCCENQIGLACGDYQYCRTACNNAFGDPKHNITASTP